MGTWRWAISAAAIVFCAGAVVFYSGYHNRVAIENFNECAGAGYQVSQTYPLQCEANGRVFVQEESDPTMVAVENVVTNFGSMMQLVSVGAPKALAAQAILDNYRDLVSPSLLDMWTANPAEAPGRTVSSPWPDHIEITSVLQISSTTYAVAGNVVELTSDNVAHGGIADKYAATATVAVEGGNWVITSWASSRS